MTFSDKDFENKIKKLPADTQKAIADLDVFEKMIEIRDDNDLYINEGSLLYDEIKKVIAGESSAADFPRNLKRVLDGVDEQKLNAIIADVDKKIFSQIKLGMMQLEMNDAGAKTAPAEENHSLLKKEDVLSGIESPVDSSALSRVEHVQSYVEPPKVEVKAPENLSASSAIPPAPPTAPSIPGNPVKPEAPNLPPNKLTEIVKTPREEIEIKAPPPAATPPSAGPKIDPYREPIN